VRPLPSCALLTGAARRAAAAAGAGIEDPLVNPGDSVTAAQTSRRAEDLAHAEAREGRPSLRSFHHLAPRKKLLPEGVIPTVAEALARPYFGVVK
jgi:hypothetical protein